MPVPHPTGGGHPYILCIVALVCCLVGVISLYKAMTCREFRESAEEGKARAPLSAGKIMSGLLGLLGLAAGIIIILRILKG